MAAGQVLVPVAQVGCKRSVWLSALGRDPDKVEVTMVPLTGAAEFWV